MDPSSIALLAFSSVLVVGSATFIIVVNYNRYCRSPKPTTTVDWVVSENVVNV
jgi:hypothetical protein